MDNKTKVEKFSAALVDKLFVDETEEEQEIIAYGLTVVCTTIGSFLAIIFLSGLVGITPLAITAAVSASIVKLFSGGVHAANFRTCATISAIIFTTIGWFSYHADSLIIIENNLLLGLVFLSGTYILYLYAPADVEEKPLDSVKKKSKAKIHSILIFSCLNLVFLILSLNQVASSYILAGLLGMLWTLFSTTPVAYKLFNRQYIRRCD
ncbi:accessory gene regulator B family protein [Natroniella acetigena]|uniref:accessory gene regulator ArgB-like protein n=1 Tax=Natroniella acetigena TaxID=52004 RepID=UPI00200AF467|nr:accessory gene regulator B family protein [Natroniella acetigena]MCK8826866.1 accessory gene regulator B family protein [Natroniella acetigena]